MKTKANRLKYRKTRKQSSENSKQENENRKLKQLGGKKQWI